MRSTAMRAAFLRCAATRGSALAARGGVEGSVGTGAVALRSASTHPLRASQVVLVRWASASASAASPPKSGSKASDDKFAWAVTDMAPPSPGRGFMGRSANFDVTQKQGQLKRWEWLLKLLGFLNEDDRLFRESTRVFQSCVNVTGRPEYYRALGLPRSFRAQQALLMVHVWLVHRRLALEGKEGQVLQELVFDRLWEETVVRIRYMDISEMTVNKHLASVQQICFNACMAYDQGLKQGPAVFQTAVAQHLLDDESPEGLRIASAMADYMKRELKNLERVDAKHIMVGTIPWSTHLASPAASSGKQKQSVGTTEEDDEDVTLIGQVFGNWRSALDNRGKLYYWNLTTRYSVWDRPTGEQLHEGEDRK